MHLTNTMSAWAHQQSKLNCKQAIKQTSKQVQAAAAAIKTDFAPATRNQNWGLVPQASNQTLSPPEGNLETKVPNPQEMCRTEMTREDQSGPGVAGLLPLVLLKQVSHQMVRRAHCPACLYARSVWPWGRSLGVNDPESLEDLFLKSLRRDCESIQAHSNWSNKPSLTSSRLEGANTPCLKWPTLMPILLDLTAGHRRDKRKRQKRQPTTKSLQRSSSAPLVGWEGDQPIKF